MGNLDLLEDACARLPHSTRGMFGGHGLFAQNGGMFAGVVDDDKVVLKFPLASKEREAFIAEGGEPWTYLNAAKPMTMREWIVIPDRLYDEPRALSEWAAKAHRLAPAKGAKKAKAPAPAKKPAKKGR